MFLLVLFGSGMFVFGCMMVAKPDAFAKGITEFSNKPWFHLFEIVSRLTLGVLLLLFAEQTSYPLVVQTIGGVLCVVGLFLIVIGSERHRKFASLTAKIGRYFRPIGIVAQLCGLGLVYLGFN
ncbi:MAG: hypothetical protein BM565_13845 [Gammaproteobacteria bacterium MedPE]|nr:MAG: hypothetical protein BM565_13845 [Gammaproteobacteria bacterium MedPE]